MRQTPEAVLCNERPLQQEARAPQLEKAHTQQQRPDAAKNKQINNLKPKYAYQIDEWQECSRVTNISDSRRILKSFIVYLTEWKF